MKRWLLPELDREAVKELAARFVLPPFSAMLLHIRGITKRDEIESFFSVDPELPDPLLIKDMDKAVERIRTALRFREYVCVYGDYDCDGVTATALLYSYLYGLDANVMYYIPDRNAEGYGLNKESVKKLADKGVRLIITVDNGISSIDEIDYAASLGLDVIVTDHHTPRDMLPKAVAVVNPHRNDDTSSFKDYCGAGVALMLCIALEGDSFSVIENFADLAAMGTVADLVPIKEQNRTIVKAGLMYMDNTDRPGIMSLVRAAGGGTVDSGSVGFKLAPRINAAGRLGSPYDAVRLLLTEDEDEADRLADELSGLNSRRQSIEAGIFEEICGMIESRPELALDRVLVISSPGWNPGVIGIVASRITDRYGKPCILISESEEISKGSGRSVDGFSLVDAVFACSNLLTKYGGHPMAAGLSIPTKNIDAFRRAINAYADKLEYMPDPSIKVDCKLNPEAIVVDMVHQLENFEPFGYGNPRPVFALMNMRLDRVIPLSGGKHIKLAVSRGKARLNLLKFSTTPEEFPYPEGSMLDFAVALELNTFQQMENISFKIRDIRPSDFNTELAMKEIQLYEMYRRGIVRETMRELCPERNDFAAVYMYLKRTPCPIYTEDSILSGIKTPGVGAFKLLMTLDIMKELELIRYSRKGNALNIELNHTSSKVDLNSSEIYRKLKEDINYV